MRVRIAFAAGLAVLGIWSRTTTFAQAQPGSRSAEPMILLTDEPDPEAVDQERTRMDRLEQQYDADPNEASVILGLAHAYASALFNQSPLASRARVALESSDNVWLLGNTAYMLQSLYNSSLQMDNPKAFAAELAELYFLKAHAIDPSLHREKVLPQIDMEEIRRGWQAMEEERLRREALAKAAVSEMRRLPPGAFPELPKTVADVLQARGCRVPQPSPEGALLNVIRGEFFSSGEAGWAVLCSVDYFTSLLVFRNDRDTDPETLSTSDDWVDLQFLDDEKIGYSRLITAVGRDAIMRHYNADDSPEPPPIDHHGIDDAIIEKGSVTFYHYQGEWLGLPGTD